MSSSASKRGKALPVLGQVDRSRRRAEDRHTQALEPIGQVERRLPAELHDHAFGPFPLDHVQHVLQRQRLEIQPVGGVVVGGDRLRIAVEHDRLEAQAGQGKCGLAAAVIELDALADAVRPAAEDQDLAAAGGAGFVLGFVGAVQIGRLCLELGCTGVDALEGGVDGEALAEEAEVDGSPTPSAALAPPRGGGGGKEAGQVAIGKAHLFGLAKQSRNLSPTLSWEERESGGEMGIAEFLVEFGDRRCGEFEKGQLSLDFSDLRQLR